MTLRDRSVRLAEEVTPTPCSCCAHVGTREFAESKKTVADAIEAQAKFFARKAIVEYAKLFCIRATQETHGIPEAVEAAARSRW